MRSRIALRDRERGDGKVDRCDIEILPLASDGNRDTSAAGADVEHARAVWRSRDRGLHEELRLRTRNEHAIVDEELTPEELRTSANVLQRLAVYPPLHERLDRRRIDALL